MKTYRKKIKNLHKKTNKNKARGPKSFTRSSLSLGKSVILPPLKKSLKNSKMNNNKSVRSKHVQINTHENELYEYSLGTSERQWKKNDRITGIPKCKKPKFRRDFPCKIKRTVFNNFDDYADYLQLKHDNNYSTGYKSKEEHYDDIEAMLMWKGSDLQRK